MRHFSEEVIALWTVSALVFDTVVEYNEVVFCIFPGWVSTGGEPFSEESVVHSGILSNLTGQSASHLAAAQVSTLIHFLSDVCSYKSGIYTQTNLCAMPKLMLMMMMMMLMVMQRIMSRKEKEEVVMMTLCGVILNICILAFSFIAYFINILILLCILFRYVQVHRCR